MKIIGMIPARGGSTRFNNKPLALICGKPMVYWVWKHSKEVAVFDEVYVATDSDEIKEVAESFGTKVIMTSSDCETATERLWEVSHKVDAEGKSTTQKTIRKKSQTTKSIIHDKDLSESRTDKNAR